MKNWKLLTVILASLLFVLAACGSDDKKNQIQTLLQGRRQLLKMQRVLHTQ